MRWNGCWLDGETASVTAHAVDTFLSGGCTAGVLPPPDGSVSGPGALTVIGSSHAEPEQAIMSCQIVNFCDPCALTLTHPPAQLRVCEVRPVYKWSRH
jgi:hypothetical protein